MPFDRACLAATTRRHDFMESYIGDLTGARGYRDHGRRQARPPSEPRIREAEPRVNLVLHIWRQKTPRSESTFARYESRYPDGGGSS
jgi:hypothetical protein